MKHFSINSIGRCIPKNKVTSDKIDELCNLPAGYTEKNLYIKSRYWAEPINETTLSMAKNAVDDALLKANLSIEDVDCIISGGSLVPQILPCTASLLLSYYQTSGQDCFDVDCTCLGFLKALEIADCLFKVKNYKNILIFCSELPSLGITKNDYATFSLFGDGAVAVILSASQNSSSSVIASLFQTFPDGGNYSQCRGCGTLTHPNRTGQLPDITSFYFEMDGPKIFKTAAKYFNNFLESLLKKANVSLQDINFVIPHQASYHGIMHIQKRLGIEQDKVICIIENYGNQVAASIPNALYELNSKKQLHKGDKILFLGAASGLVLGGLIFEY